MGRAWLSRNALGLVIAVALSMGAASSAQEAPPAEAPPAEAPPAEAPPAEAPPAEAPPAEAPPAPPPPPPLPPLSQVQIQVWISETGEQGLRDLGANLSYTRFVDGDEQSGSVQQIDTTVQDLVNPKFTVTMPAPNPTLFGTPARPDRSGTIADGVQTQEGAGLTFSIIKTDYGTVDGAFRSVERKSDLDLISKPELLVINGTPATIHAGGQVPYQSIIYNNQGQGQLHVVWQDIGVKLGLVPTIRENEMVELNLTELLVSDVARVDNIRGIDLPVFSTRQQTGTVLVPNGQTLVVGGLASRVVRKTERRVPIVGRVPVLGIPFRGRRSEASTSHLLIFVSPTIVDLLKLDQSAVDALEFWRRERWLHEREIDQEFELLGDDL